ncbi:MAG: hypothetical protein MJ250_07415 [Alphaproteobacteria bacterium]|nr:hypothetical protein [Alphaproteobacteria bacterium]
MKKTKQLLILFSTILATMSVKAADVSIEDTLQADYDQKKQLIDEMFKKKVEKIRQKDVLPDRIRNLLIRQADEIRDYDLQVLNKKLQIKLRQAKERDVAREEMRKEAQERIKWVLENEAEFQVEKAAQDEAETKKLNQVEVDKSLPKTVKE